jgi:hypothetical protein
MPLRKRGPQLRKRTPSRSGRGGRGPGAAGERALRPNVVASPTGPRSSTQSPHHAKNRQNRTDRASTDARPRLQPPVPTSDSSPTLPRPPSASPRWSTHRSHSTYQSTHHTRPCPVAAAPPPAQQHPPGQTRPTFTWHVEEGGPAQRAGPPSSKAQAGSERSTRGRGGGPFALKTNTWKRTARDEHLEMNTPRRPPAPQRRMGRGSVPAHARWQRSGRDPPDTRRPCGGRSPRRSGRGSFELSAQLVRANWPTASSGTAP